MIDRMTSRRWRKGVSPLIAAVLLIAFTMAVAAILTAWVTTFTQQTTADVGNRTGQFVECSGGVIEIVEASSTGSGVNVIVANRGTADLRNISVTGSSEGAIVDTGYIAPFDSGAVGDVSLSGSGIDTVRVGSRNCPTVSDSTVPS